MRLGGKEIGHESDHEGLRHGFIKADRKRHVLVGKGRSRDRHEKMPGHPQHRCHHPFIERRLAEFFACKVGIDCDNLDHVPAQNREMLFVHWLHEGGLSSASRSANGPLDIKG
jgi:hypothetical protein